VVFPDLQFLAEKYDANIQIITVVPLVLIPTYSFHAVTSKGLEECAKRLEDGFNEILSQAIEKVKKVNPALLISAKLERGHPDSKIVQAAKLENCDIIVMGSQGLSRREFGVVSSRVAQKSPCPVVIVK